MNLRNKTLFRYEISLRESIHGVTSMFCNVLSPSDSARVDVLRIYCLESENRHCAQSQVTAVARKAIQPYIPKRGKFSFRRRKQGLPRLMRGLLTVILQLEYSVSMRNML